MSNIRHAFEKGKAFIPFITCGDPSLDVTEELVLAMEEAEADLIELGIPFSDPTAEGPVIQEANLRALSGGVTTDDIFLMVRRLRKRTRIPLVFIPHQSPQILVLSSGIHLQRTLKSLYFHAASAAEQIADGALHIIDRNRMPKRCLASCQPYLI